MPKKDYDIDDILSEVDSTKRKNKGALADSPKSNAPSAKKDLSVTQILTDLPETRGNSTARQYTERQSEERLRRDISLAFDSRKAVKITDDEEKEIHSARQLTEQEYEARVAKDISDAADVKLYEKNKVQPFDPETADTTEVEKFSDHVKPFTKPEISGDDDEIFFHTRGDLITTDTMEMRKQQKIDEINRALLKADREAQSPEEMLDLINPMVSKEKVTDMLKGGDTDTLTVAGGDLKRIAHSGERVREYQPAASKQKDADEPLFSPAAKQQPNPLIGELHVGETIVDALNKKIAEENKQKYGLFKEGEEPAENTKKSPEPAAEENARDGGKAEKIRAASELAQKKMRKISDFILENPEAERPAEDDDDEDDSAAGYDEEFEEAIDLDDEKVIRDRLSRASKGLVTRLVVLGLLFAAALFVAIVNIANLDVGTLSGIINIRRDPSNYLYTNLTIGILSFAACSSVVSNGFSRLFRLKPDGDTLCALSHTAAIAAILPHLIRTEYIQRSYSHVYLLVSLGLLCFNTVSKLITVRTAKKNYAFISSEKTKYFVERCDGDSAQQLAKGAVTGIPVIASMRKTEMLYDFIVSTYCEDISDRVLGKTAVASLIASVVGGIAAFLTESGSGGTVRELTQETIMLNKLSWGFSVMSAILCLGAAFACSMTVTIPLLMSAGSRKSKKYAILGYDTVDNFSETNAVLIDAKTLIPPGSVKITNICGYKKSRSGGEGKINVDEAIIYAASLAVKSDSVLSDAFFGMLGYNQDLLEQVNGVVYENNLGVMGWIDRRRVLLGTRAHMLSHEISVPNVKKEMAANVNNDEVVYLAVGGEVCLLFFVGITPDRTVNYCVNKLYRRGISLIVRTVDGFVTNDLIADLFLIDDKVVKIIPFESHEAFGNHTKFTSRGSAAMCCDGSFTSFTDAVCASKSLKTRISAGCMIQTFGVALGILLALIFMLFSKYDVFNEIYITIYNLVWAAVTVGVQACMGFAEKLSAKKNDDNPMIDDAEKAAGND